MQKIKRIFNNRPLCFFAFFFIIGLLITEGIYPNSALFRLIPLLLSLSFTAGFLFFKSTRKFSYMAFALALGVLFMSGACDVYITRSIKGGYIEIEGRVASEIVVEDGVTSFTLEDVSTPDGDIKGRVAVRVWHSVEPNFGAGDTVRMDGELSFYEHERFDTFYSWRATSRKFYDMESSGNVEKISDGEAPFPGNLQLAVKKVLYENLGDDAGICIALILGDKVGLDGELYDDVKNSGLAHVLAVSGLHVTTLATMLYFLLKKLKVNTKASFLVVAVLTLFYVMLCSFTPSAVRALIMTCVLNFSNAFGLKSDKLSSLSLAAILLLFINPLNILSVGFLLSFFAVLGLFLFGSSFETFLRNLVLLPKNDSRRLFKVAGLNGAEMLDRTGSIVYERARSYFCSACAVCFAANVFTLPLSAFFFGEVQTLFFLSNLIMVPYLMFIYLFLILNTFFALITTSGGGLVATKMLLIPFKAWVASIGSLPFAAVSVPVGVIFLFCWIFSAVVLSSYVFLNRRTKFSVLLVWWSVCLALSVAAILATN